MPLHTWNLKKLAFELVRNLLGTVCRVNGNSIVFSLYSLSKNIIWVLLFFSMETNLHNLCECKP